MNFFKHLQDSGSETFQDIENRMVYTFFFNGERQIRGKDYCSLVKAVLKTIVPLYGETVQKTLGTLPVIKSGKKNFHYLTQEESIKIRECLEKEVLNIKSYEDMTFIKLVSILQFVL